MMKRRIMISAAVTSLLLMAGSAEAKFGVKIPKNSGGGGDTSALKADLEKATQGVLAECSAARVSFIKAQVIMVIALDLKVERTTEEAEVRTIKEGNTSVSDLKKLTSVSEHFGSTLDEGIMNFGDQELTSKEKKMFAKGLIFFIEGLSKEAKQVQEAVKLGEMAKEIVDNASGIDKASAIHVAEPALLLASMIPGDVQSATSSLGGIIAFCKKQNISLPKDAEKFI